jgi:hypothetical protein
MKNIFLVLSLLACQSITISSHAGDLSVSKVKTEALFCQKGDVKIYHANTSYEKVVCVVQWKNGASYQMSYGKGDSFTIMSKPAKDGSFDPLPAVTAIVDAAKLLGYSELQDEIVTHFSSMPLSSNYDNSVKIGELSFNYTDKRGFQTYNNYMVEIWPAN